VIRLSGHDKGKKPVWLCECECGKTAEIRAAFLKRGQEYCSKQCPIYHREKLLVDLTGKRFGKLTAIERIGQAKRSKAIWLFQCDCGEVATRVADNILHGGTQSCGCMGMASRIKHGKSQTLEYHRDAHRRWAKENPAKAIANSNKRRADFRLRIPPWLTSEHWEQINAFYLEAAELTKRTGIPHCVDHVHPLRGKKCSGLHVPWNLQVLTQAENLHKSARLLDDVC
jgi:5-methylcytosine-specific restriction endonuclease McrA